MTPENTFHKILKQQTDSECRKKFNDLFTFFCNQVYLGQWELARTTIATLTKNFDGNDSANFFFVLKTLAESPISQSLGSNTVPSPHHLSWLCLQELKIHLPETEKHWIDQLEKDVDFRLTLFLIKDIEDVVIQELYGFFQRSNLKISISGTQGDSGQLGLSTNALNAIKKVLVTSPSLGHSVIRSLMGVKESSEKKTNEILQGLYIECINYLLDQIKDAQQSSILENLWGKLFQILSYYDPVPYWNYLQLRQLFSRLLTVAKEHQVAAEAIVSVLTGRKSPYLLDEFCKIFHESSLLVTSSLLENSTSTLNHGQRISLQILTNVERDVCWRDFFIMCYKKRVHFLAEVLNLSLSLIKSGLFMELQDLLSYPEFQPLKSAVLLMGWSHCVTAAEARTLLDTLWDVSDGTQCPALSSSCRKLAYNLDLIQWCLDRAKPLLSSSELSQSHQATQLLQGLQTYSVLYMLHHSTSIASLDHAEVLELLSHVTTDKSKELKRKSVTFQDESKAAPPEQINIEQQKDLSVFRSYCAMKNVMDSLVFCFTNFEHKLMNPVHIKRMVKPKRLDHHFLKDQTVSSSEGEDSSSPFAVQLKQSSEADGISVKVSDQASDIFIQSYHDSVTKKLKEARNYLAHIQPLTYRLEILENIFSLICVTHEDLQDRVDLETDDENDEVKKHSLDNLGCDSLNISLISEDEFSLKASPKKSSKDEPSPLQTCPSSLDYDVPFVDPYSQPVHEALPESSYFTLSLEHQKKVEQYSKQVENTTLNKKKRKRRRSNSECCPNILVGFLANEYLVRDLLHLLKAALADLNAAKFSVHSQPTSSPAKDYDKHPRQKLVDPALESALQSSLQTSIQPEQFVQRTTKLTQAVHEAWWRYQLVAHDAIPREAGHILSERVIVTDNDIHFLPACDTQVFATDKASELSSTEENRGRSVSTYTVISQANIVSQMMSSPESLLVHSLIKGSPSQASEVIKLFQLSEKTSECCEVTFCDLYQSSASKIWNLETESRDLKQNPPKLGKRSVKALSKAAAVGVATASLSNIVEDLLSKPCLPPTPKPKSPSCRETFSQLFNVDSCSAVLLDLLCTACHSWDSCSNMLDIIKTRSKFLERNPSQPASPDLSDLPEPSSDPVESSLGSVSPKSSKVIHLLGTKPPVLGVKNCHQFIWNLYDLLHAGDHQTARGHHLVTQSLQHHFHSAYSSFDVSKLRSLNIAVMELRRAVDHIQHTLTGSLQGQQMDISVEDQGSSPSLSSRGSTSSYSGSTTGSSPSLTRVSTKHQTESENPLHVSFKYLMYIMEKHAPGAGLTQLLHYKNCPVFKNYLLSLYKHLKEMSHLMAECQDGIKDFQKNYFKVLEEGPISILGRLMFVKKMPPARLEAVAVKLSLNLTHTIVYSCCPKIPSKHPPLKQITDCSIQKSSTRVYNISSHIASNICQDGCHPEELVQKIISDLVSVMEGIAKEQNANGVFDLSCGKYLVQQEAFTSLTCSVQCLQSVDLTLLRTNEEKLCFLINLTNLMIVHCHLSNVKARFECQSDEESLDLFPLAAADNLIYFSSFSYSIGQFGLVSVFDLLTIIGHDELQSSTQWKNLLASRSFVLSPDDPWKKFVPLPEPRVLFAINTGCNSSPPLKVFKPSTVESQLELAMKEYLSHTVMVSVEKEKVWVPELLLWSEKKFVEPVSRKERFTNLLNWLLGYLSAEKQIQLQQLLKLDSVHSDNNEDTTELPFQVEMDHFDNSFSFTFDIHHVKTGQVEPLKPKKPKASSYPFTNSYEKSGQGWSLKLPMYNLTPVTLEYVKQDSLLVATMVSLVCADNLDNIEQQFTDDHFNQPESGPYHEPLMRLARSSSDISLVDIRSYRYQRLTDDYPILQRHLLHYILPLAGAENSELLESREPILKFVTNDIGDQVKLCMFSLPNSVQFQFVIQDMANRLLEDHKWTETLNILRSLPSSVVSEHIHLQILHDFVLSCWAITQTKKGGPFTKVADGLRKFYNPFIQARTILTVCDVLPIMLSRDLLDLCLTLLDRESGLWLAVHNKFQLYSLYCKIYDCAQRLRGETADCPLGQADLQLSQTLDKLNDSQQISGYCCANPCDILKVLEKSGDFVSAAAWAELQSLSLEVVRGIKQNHIYYLLTLETPDTLTAFQLLDALLTTSPPECLSVCQTLVGSLVQPKEIKFVLSFMLKYLPNQLPSEDLEDLMLRRIGAKALMCLPSRLQTEYNHLISCPRLILEQLLMNMKVELAGHIFEQVKLDFNNIKEVKLRVTQEEFNGLLVAYSNKAVQVNVVQVTRSRFLTEPSRSVSANSGSSAGLDELNVPQQHFTDVRNRDPSVSPTGSFVNRLEAVGKVQRKQSLLLARDKQLFMMPAQPPTQDQWMPDSATSVCMVCSVERFSMFNRRHHCRRCGRVVCATCSSKQTLVFNVMSRTCDDCWQQINNFSDHKYEHEIYSQRIREHISGVSSSPSSLASPPPSGLLSTLQTSDRLRHSLMSAVQHVDHAWKLRPDMAYNQQLRSEFYYEQAPSVALCVSLLKQHSSKLEAGKLILQICDHLSTYLVSVSPGVPNPEIDYSLIISVMKQLVFHAKLDFVDTHDGDMMDQTDLYLGRIDLLQVMVEANYQDLPTIKELTKQDTVRRLRDKLITDERLNLAMEVSMKCGIDPAGVWAAMGFACFNLGDFQSARDKFSHCLKVLPDKNQGSQSQSRLLGEILDFLDTIPGSGVTELQRLLGSPASICNIQNLLVPSKGEENRVDSVPYKECLYYLRTYGSYMDHIIFLRQHSYWMKAVQFAVDHHCSPDVFVNGLMIPAMNSGEMGRLLEQMLMLDPTLEKWTAYLTATCKYLLKQKYFSTLYQIQLFMKDYIRASMTCVSHFYQKSATSYLDLSGRLQFLITAQQHLQAYLDPSQWGSVPHPLAPRTPSKLTVTGPSWDKASPESAARMTLTPDQVNRHIRTINLQIEATKFLEQSLTQASSSSALPSLSQVPTLFGQSSARTELVSLIILSETDFKARFTLAVKIVKECRLNPTLLFTHCSRELAKQSRFSEITSLTQALVEEGLMNDEGIDEIVGASLLVIADSHSEDRDQSDTLIQLLRSDTNKINAFILCGKLRSAYLLAVKRDSVDDVQRIAGAAQRLGQAAVKNICKKWLEQHQK